jgi:putative hydrolase of the HAD superfamily
MLFAEAPASEVAGCELDWWREVVRDTFRRADASPRDFDACFEALYNDFARPEAWVAEPEVHSTLKALRARGLAIAVVSNFDHRLPHLLAGLGLAALIDAVVIPSSARAIKPNPAIFQAALALLGCTAPQAVVVGDDPARDLAAGRAAGLRAIDVRELATLADLPARLDDPAISTRRPRSTP